MNIFVKSHPFKRRAELFPIEPGVSVRDVAGTLPGAGPEKIPYEFFINGEPVHTEEWERRTIHEEETIVACRIPEDGALGIAAFIMAAFNPAFLVTFAGSFAVTQNFDKSVQMASLVGFGPVAPLLNTAILGVNRPKSESGSDPLTSSITGIGNRTDPFGVIPKSYGKTKVFPKFPGKIPTQYTEIVGDEQYLRGYLLVGKGPVTISDVKLGDTLFSNFQDAQIEIFEGKPGDPPNTLFTRGIQESALNIQLTLAGGWQTQTTALNTDRISVDWGFPRGLQHIQKDGDRKGRTVVVEIEYKLTSEPTTWTSLGQFTTVASTSSVKRRNHSWDVPNGQYDVRMKRTTAPGGSRDVDDTFWTALRSITNEVPVLEPECAGISFRIRATDQLNGLIDDLNCMVEAELSAYDGATWGAASLTRNPAWAIADILTGNGNRRPLSLSRLDADSFKAFADWCDLKGFKFDYTFDSETTVFAAANMAASVGLGSLDNVDGKYTIVIDKQQPTIIDHFNPRTIWGLEGSAAYPDKIHGLRIGFKNENLDGQEDERIVYDDGYNAGNATKFDFIQFPGIVTPDHIYIVGRHELAARRLRFEEWTYNTDFRRLISTRGDLCTLSHDVMLSGLGWGRIKTVKLSGSDVSGLVVDTDIIMEAGKTYGVQVQKSLNGSTIEGQIVNTENTSREVTFITPVSGIVPAIGDLVTFGIWGQISQRAIIKAIQPIKDNGNLAARLTVVAEAPGVYTAADGPIGEHTPIITIPGLPQNLRPPTPTIRTIRSSEDIAAMQDSGSYAAKMAVFVDLPSGFNAGLVNIQAQYRIWIDPLVATPNPHSWINTAFVDGSNGEIFIEGVEVILKYEVRVRALNKLNLSLISPWSAISQHTVLGDTIAPDAPTSVSVTAGDRSATLSWTNPTDEAGGTLVDFDAVEIWRSTTNDSSTAVYVAETSGETWTDTKLVNGTTYYYWLPARDFAGNLSPFHATQFAGESVTPSPNVVISTAEVLLASKNLSTLETITSLNYTTKGGRVKTTAKMWIDAATNDPGASEFADITLMKAGSPIDNYQLSFQRLGPGYPGEINFFHEEVSAIGTYTYSLSYAGSTAVARAIKISINIEEVEV